MRCDAGIERSAVARFGKKTIRVRFLVTTSQKRCGAALCPRSYYFLHQSDRYRFAGKKFAQVIITMLTITSENSSTKKIINSSV